MRQDAYKSEYLFLGIAEAGVYAEAPNPWGEHLASVMIYDRRLSCYYGDVVEGGTILDKRPAFQRDETACVREVVSGPMRGLHLPPNTVDVAFQGRQPWAPELKLGGFDYISLDLYLDRWRALGARVGRRVGPTVVWEDGEVEPIRPESERWRLDVK